MEIFVQLKEAASQALERLRGDEQGVTAIEYGLIAALIAVAIIAGVTALGDNLDVLFNNVAETVNAETPS